MTFASDQDTGLPPLSATSLRMLELRAEVMDAWMQRVRSLPETQPISQPVLVDTLPAFYDNLAQSVTAEYPRQDATEGNSLAVEHGGERARMTTYSLQALISEYQMFRWAIFEVLERHAVKLDHVQTLTVHASIDAGISEAVHGFTLIHNGLRENFSAALTHDMRTPLGVAVTALELSLMTPDLAKSREMAGKALTSLKRMDSMIGELLHSMAFTGGHPMQIDCSRVDALELAREVQADAEALHGPRVILSGEPVLGWWGRPELKRALENIVGNGLKYSPAGSPVRVDVSENYGRLVVSVHNEGDPIPLEEQAGIFLLYQRAEPPSPTQPHGWGIGLPYVRTVAESHGGSVGVDSSRERGTTFTIDIPLDLRTLKPSEPAQSSPQRPGGTTSGR